MSTKTERITILGTPDFKAFLNKEATKEGISVSELVRDRCINNTADQKDEQFLLAELTKELRTSTKRAKKSLDQGIKKANHVLKIIEVREANAQ